MAETHKHTESGGRPRQPKFVVICHQESVTENNSTAGNLAAVFSAAEPDLRIVVIDLYPKAVTSRSLLNSDELPSTGAYDVIVSGEISTGSIRMAKATSCLLIPATERLATAETDPALLSLALGDAAEKLRENLVGTDLVIIDNPPGSGVLTTLGISMANSIIVPTPIPPPDKGALHQAIDHIEKLRPDAGMVLSLVISRTEADESEQNSLTGELSDEFGKYLSAISIPHSPFAADGEQECALIVVQAPDSPIAHAFRQLSSKIGERLGIDLNIPLKDEPATEDEIPSVPAQQPDGPPIPELMHPPDAVSPATSQPSTPPTPSAARPHSPAPQALHRGDTNADGDTAGARPAAPPTPGSPLQTEKPAKPKPDFIFRFILALALFILPGAGTFLFLLDPAYLEWALSAAIAWFIILLSALYFKIF